MIIQAPNAVDVEGPVIYLAGPVQGCEDWQEEAIHHLGKLDADLQVANPRCRAFHGAYRKQEEWMSNYMDRAATDGAIVFWFPPETRHRCNRPYASTERLLLGAWATRGEYEKNNTIVGVDSRFSGGAFLRDYLDSHHPRIPVCRTLRQTCAVAVELVRKGRGTSLYDLLRRAEENVGA